MNIKYRNELGGGEMKLLYLWKPKYGHLQFADGIAFSPEYRFEFLRDNCELKIMSKPYISNFYGKNISEITAIVGSNGSGKTTVALNICRYCETTKAIVANNSTPDEEFVQVYKRDEEILIYYYLSGCKLTYYCDLKLIKCYDVSRLNDDGEFGYARESNKHNLTSVYITNIFNPDDMTIRSKMPNLAIGSTNHSVAYSPSNCMRLAKSRYKDGYGAGADGIHGRIWSHINYYEKRMSDDGFRAYENYHGELFIRCYLNAPKDIINALPIFHNYILGVHQFGSYINGLEPDDPNLNEIDKSVMEIQRKNKNFDSLNRTVFEQCFINILCEADLHFGYIKKDNGDLTRSKVGEILDEYWISKECHIDIDLLNKISSGILNWENKNQNFEKTVWLQQLKNSIEVFERYKDDKFITSKDGSVSIQKFGEMDYILKFFLSECERDVSFFHRYFIFTPLPSSAGELALVNIFAYINDALTKKNNNNVILVIDEIDAMLHPIWQQMILKNLVEYIEKRYYEKQFQIVFTTHSPIILSDMTSDRVVKLKKEGGIVNVNTCINPILGANIEKLFYDDFFMDKGSIGELAKSHILEVLNYNNGEMNISYERAEYILSNIGEPFVKNKLKRDFDRTRSPETSEELISMIKKMGSNEALRILKETSAKED